MDIAHTVLARDASDQPSSYKAIGIILAVCSGLFIGVSFVFKKIGLLRANKKYHQEAGEGYGYLKNAFWWCGMTLMILGELCNVVAYCFVDAILVTPFGALSVVVTTILSAIFLKERLSFVGKIGCFNCILGSIIIALNAPSQQSASTIQEMQKFFITPWFLTYAGVIIVGCIFVALWVAPRYGKTNMFVYLTICSLIGGLSVSAIQGLGAAILAQIRGVEQFNQWFLYFLFVFVVCTLVTEIIFLNKALNIFNAALVTPTYYVYFTSATIVTSAILFKGFKASVTDILSVVFGFFVICSGAVLLQLAKSSKDVPDTAVFSGDLDQVRTIAEQEEPESEPRADTVRAGASIVRALSKRRSMRQLEEAKTMMSEHMEPIAENETVEWDGLRRRKTVLTPGQPSIRRSKTIHPPLGHATNSIHTDDASELDDDDHMHPGFFPRFGRRSTRKSERSNSGRHASPSPVAMTSVPNKSAPSTEREHVYGLPAGLRKETDGANDTSYNPSNRDVSGSTNSTVHFTPSVASSRPPRPPLHSAASGSRDGSGAKRHFSFQNVFRPKSPSTSSIRESDNSISQNIHPHSRDQDFSYASMKKNLGGVSEEERLGLVTGDSKTPLPAYTEEPEEYVNRDDDWQVTSGSSESPVHIGRPDTQNGTRPTRDRDSLDSDVEDSFYHPVKRQSAF